MSAIKALAERVVDAAGQAGGIDEVRRIAEHGWPFARTIVLATVKADADADDPLAAAVDHVAEETGIDYWMLSADFADEDCERVHVSYVGTAKAVRDAIQARAAEVVAQEDESKEASTRQARVKLANKLVSIARRLLASPPNKSGPVSTYSHPLLIALNIMKVFPSYEAATARGGEYGYAAALRNRAVHGSDAGVYAGLRILRMIKNGVEMSKVRDYAAGIWTGMGRRTILEAGQKAADEAYPAFLEAVKNWEF